MSGETTATQPEETQAEEAASGRPVVFFDGVCGLCNASVDFILARDRRGKFLFAPLQGETAKQRLPEEFTADLDSIVLQANGKNYRHSSAVARVLLKLGGVWSVLGALLWLIPWPLRHAGYKIVAANRYRWFGRKDSCRMPTPEERARFLP